MSNASYRYELAAKITRRDGGSSTEVVREMKWDEVDPDVDYGMLQELVRFILHNDVDERLTRTELLVEVMLHGDCEDGSEGMEDFARTLLWAFGVWQRMHKKKGSTFQDYFKLCLEGAVSANPNIKLPGDFAYHLGLFCSSGGRRAL